MTKPKEKKSGEKIETPKGASETTTTKKLKSKSGPPQDAATKAAVEGKVKKEPVPAVVKPEKEKVQATVNSVKTIKKTKEFLKYVFTHDEIHNFGSDLARINTELSALESEKKAITSEFKAKIDAKTSEVESISQKINSGYEHRYIQCEIRLNEPNTGMKTIVRTDTGEVVKKESMTPEEMQVELFTEDFIDQM